MENQDFKIDIKIVWILAICNVLLNCVGVLFLIQHWELSPTLTTVSFIVFFVTWIIVISDMTKNKIYNKSFWITSMFVLPSITAIFYLIRKDNLIKFEARFSKSAH
ncbi:MAG: hypothetical protein ACOYMD_04490 [Paludibacter sp.]